MGNWSLGLVTVSFNQVMRALVPGTTLLLSMAMLRAKYSTSQKVALVPVALGVCIACTGNKSATALGVVVTIIAWTVLQATPSNDRFSALSLYCLTGVFSFALNVTSLYANRATSAITLAVCANLKQVAVIVLAVYMHGDPMSCHTIVGAALVTAGGAWYTVTSQPKSKE
ncbi:hypothetical protein DYB32_004346 [Aphanomyces invadans]|uniref:Sugar phosphate transporter domain-containing protein n=1 Tax=Aphanomyces invadans TaxID=157072 RepID=A0A3R6VBU1_9STRA|nr:hypothetical protein DYB32_004346 [Aphanomyces invadans]